MAGVRSSLSRMFVGLRLATGPAGFSVSCVSSMSAIAAPVLLQQRARRNQHAFSASVISHPRATVSTVMGSSYGNNMLLTGAAAAVAAAARHGSKVNSVCAAAGVRSISSTGPRTKGLDDFFVSFPVQDKDGKSSFPAAGAFSIPLSPPLCWGRITLLSKPRWERQTPRL